MTLARSPYEPDVGVIAGRTPWEENRGAPLVVGRASITGAAHAGGGLRAPTRDELGYARELMIVVLMLLALPWLLRMAIRDPGALVRGAGPAAIK